MTDVCIVLHTKTLLSNMRSFAEVELILKADGRHDGQGAEGKADHGKFKGCRKISLID